MNQSSMGDNCPFITMVYNNSLMCDANIVPIFSRNKKEIILRVVHVEISKVLKDRCMIKIGVEGITEEM
jgi:hypothetical protein